MWNFKFTQGNWLCNIQMTTNERAVSDLNWFGKTYDHSLLHISTNLYNPQSAQNIKKNKYRQFS